jgi:pimeloyl-ACP methyl ester carboxylesterase
MDRATERIEQHIDRERELLRSNLAELEERVRSVVDWRQHYRSQPALWVGVAFGGGLLLALARRRDYPRGGEALVGYSDHRRREISRAWSTIESALIGVAAARLKDALLRVLPGFGEKPSRREGYRYTYEPAAKDRSQH